MPNYLTNVANSNIDAKSIYENQALVYKHKYDLFRGMVDIVTPIMNAKYASEHPETVNTNQSSFEESPECSDLQQKVDEFESNDNVFDLEAMQLKISDDFVIQRPVLVNGENTDSIETVKKFLRTQVKEFRKLIPFTATYYDKRFSDNFRDMIDMIDPDNIKGNLLKAEMDSPFLRELRALFPITPKDSPKISYAESKKVFMGHDGSIQSDDNNIYDDFMNLKDAYHEAAELEFRKIKLEENYWPEAGKQKYLKDLRALNDKIIVSFYNISDSSQNDKMRPVYSKYMDNDLNTISGLKSDLGRGNAKIAGYAEGVNKAMDNGWDVNEFPIMGTIGSILGYYVSLKQNIMMKLDQLSEEISNAAKMERGNKDGAAEERESQKKQAEYDEWKKKLDYFEGEFGEDISELSDVAYAQKIHSDADKKVVIDKFATFANKYSPIINEFNAGNFENEYAKDVSEIMGYVTSNGYLLEKTIGNINARIENNKETQRIYDQKMENLNEVDFYKMASLHGWPNRTKEDYNSDLKDFMVGLHRLNKIVKETGSEFNRYKDAKKWVTDVQNLYSDIATKHLGSYDNYKNILDRASEIVATKPEFIKSNNNFELFKTSVGKLKNAKLSEARKVSMEGITEERYTLLKNIVVNLRHQKNKKAHGSNAKENTEYTEMVDALDKLVKLGPETMIAEKDREEYCSKKKEAETKLINYIKKKGFAEAWFEEGTRKRDATLLAIYAINPVKGAKGIRMANKTRHFWQKTSIEKLKNAEGVGKTFKVDDHMYKPEKTGGIKK